MLICLTGVYKLVVSDGYKILIHNNLYMLLVLPTR